MEYPDIHIGKDDDIVKRFPSDYGYKPTWHDIINTQAETLRAAGYDFYIELNTIHVTEWDSFKIVVDMHI